jgi:hypothetical protein
VLPLVCTVKVCANAAPARKIRKALLIKALTSICALASLLG